MARDLTLLTDLYQLTMMSGYLKNGKEKDIAVFDLFFRRNNIISYSVAAGLQQAVEYIRSIHFTDEDIAYLRSLRLFDKNFLEYLKTFRFTGDVYAVPEGTIVFPEEPLVTVKAPLLEAQFLETALLNIINHQTLIATKAAKIAYAAEGETVMEFGLRRAQGPDAGVYGARAAVIGGCGSTSNVLAGQLFGIPVAGTHAHSWVMNFPSEYEAFRAYAEIFPDACLLLVDTYDTLQAESGQKLCIIAMKPNDAIQEDKYKSYFCSDDGSSVAKITIAGTEYNCMAVAVQGMPNDKSVEYTLVFEVPESASTAGSLSLTAPNLTPVEIKY